MRFGGNKARLGMGFITTPIRVLPKEQIFMFSLDSFGYHKHITQCSPETGPKISAKKDKVDML